LASSLKKSPISVLLLFSIKNDPDKVGVAVPLPPPPPPPVRSENGATGRAEVDDDRDELMAAGRSIKLPVDTPSRFPPLPTPPFPVLVDKDWLLLLLLPQGKMTFSG
jgi:hypothetical protein